MSQPWLVSTVTQLHFLPKCIVLFWNTLTYLKATTTTFPLLRGQSSSNTFTPSSGSSICPWKESPRFWPLQTLFTFSMHLSCPSNRYKVPISRSTGPIASETTNHRQENKLFGDVTLWCLRFGLAQKHELLVRIMNWAAVCCTCPPHHKELHLLISNILQSNQRSGCSFLLLCLQTFPSWLLVALHACK